MITKKTVLAVGLLFALAVAYQSLFINMRGVEYTDFFGALQVFNGKTLYRDFWDHHSPGIFYLFAAAFKIFDPSIETLRAMAAIANSLAAVAIYLVAKRFSAGQPEGIIASPLIFVTGSVSLSGLLEWAEPYSSLFIALALVLLPKHRTLSGIALGIAAIFKFNIGLLGFFALSTHYLLSSNGGALQNENTSLS